jgi:hypothetical protein
MAEPPPASISLPAQYDVQYATVTLESATWNNQSLQIVPCKV